MNTTSLLAVDPALPQRDLLLDESLMTEYLSRLIVDIEDCERLRTKYRVGTSLRVLYELNGGGRSHRIAARAFPRTRRVTNQFTSQTEINVPELNATFWIFPHDRKIKNLAVLSNIPDELKNIEGRTWSTSRIVAHAPEKSVTAQCLDDNNQIIAYAKIYAGDEGRQIFQTYKALTGKVQIPRVIAYSETHRVLLLESIAGVPLSTITESENAYFRLGEALQSLHRITPPSSLPRHTRLTPEAVTRASATISQARPDVADLVQQLSAKLIAQYTHGKPVFLHGDVHPKNIFLNEESLFLLDLDQAATGTATADLGSVIAGLYCDACTGSRTWREAFAQKHALLDGYGAPHDTHELRWHIAAALLQERALRSVTRIRPTALQKLPEILRTAETVLNGGVIEN
ncbi:MAG TPA: aminoglycoside phosphotransferase family protein [Pyrinomonadaceae bacterium]|nr:aminoglycoside phosphotransferase family protein [Pyrinomonadaceae bacterium]